MDIYKYINSRDVREHLKSIEYEFNSIEAAWIIYHCASIKPRTKLRLWKEILATMEDSVHVRRVGKKEGEERRCFEWLSKYIEIVKKYHLKCDDTDYPDELTDEECKYLDFFEKMCLVFPIPFKKGDIVKLAKSEVDSANYDYFEAPRVYLDSVVEYKAEHPDWTGCDSGDMNYHAYFFKENGEVFYDVGWYYIDLEYYREPIEGPKRNAILFSRFLKGEVDEELFARGYHKVIMESYLNNSSVDDFTQEALNTAGVGKSVYKYPYK